MATDNHAFDDLLKGVQSAVMEAQKHIEKQHMRQLEEYFEEDGTPKTMLLKIPTLEPGADGDGDGYLEVHVPKIALLPIASIRIKRMLIKFAVQIGGLSAEDGNQNRRLSIGIKQKMFGSSGTKAEVEIEFEGGDPPEIVARISDQMEKLI